MPEGKICPNQKGSLYTTFHACPKQDVEPDSHCDHGYSYAASIWPQVCDYNDRLFQQISSAYSTEVQICQRTFLPSLQDHLLLQMS